MYIQKYPERNVDSSYVKEEKGECKLKDDFKIIRGKHPMAAGVKDSYLFLLKEKEIQRK